MDALRYDSAHPWREVDAREIETSLRDFGPKNYSVIIRRHWPDATPVWGYLWHSFSNIKFEPISAEEAQAINRNYEEKLVSPRLQMERAIETQRAERLGNTILAIENNFETMCGRLKSVLRDLNEDQMEKVIKEIGLGIILNNIENLKSIKKNYFE